MRSLGGRVQAGRTVEGPLVWPFGGSLAGFWAVEGNGSIKVESVGSSFPTISEGGGIFKQNQTISEFPDFEANAGGRSGESGWPGTAHGTALRQTAKMAAGFA